MWISLTGIPKSINFDFVLSFELFVPMANFLAFMFRLFMSILFQLLESHMSHKEMSCLRAWTVYV